MTKEMYHSGGRGVVHRSNTHTDAPALGLAKPAFLQHP